MGDKQISSATNIVTLASTDVIPVERPGNTTPYKATMTEIAAYIRNSEFDWYVDLVNGDDDNLGTSLLFPLKTIAKLLTKSIITGQKIGLARGSTWNEILIVPVSDLIITSYGIGYDPVFDKSGSVNIGASGVIIINGKTSCTISNVKILASIDDAVPSTQKALYVNNSADVNIDHITIVGSKHAAIYFEGSIPVTGIRVTNCDISGHKDNAIDFNFYYHTGTIITRNYIHDGLANSAGIKVVGQNVLIENNIIDHVQTLGINASKEGGATAYLTNVEICHNIIRRLGNGYSGIYARAINVQTNGDYDSGISIHDNIIDTIYTNAGGGIYGLFGSGPLDIRNNQFLNVVGTDVASAICIDDDGAATAETQYMGYNTIGGTGTWYFGIYVVTAVDYVPTIEYNITAGGTYTVVFRDLNGFAVLTGNDW